MRVRRTILLAGASFSLLMEFLSWRFAYPNLQTDCAIFALGLTSWYAYVWYRDLARKNVTEAEKLC